MSSPVKGETRNQPRKRKQSNDDQPLFLKKAFVMVSTCPPDIACWAEDGKSFIVKDSERLAAEIIPTVYKHNKFSSFVRQLNLYGFRKVRSDSLSNTSDWWVFKHPQFRRDDENAISKIKKSSHFVEPPPNCKDEATEMKNQMANLNSRIVELDNVVAYLINTLQQQQQQQQVQASMVPMQVNTNNTNAFIQQQQPQPHSPLSTSSAVPAVLSQYQQPPQQQQQYQLQNVVDIENNNINNNHNTTTHDKKRKIKATAGGGGESPRIYNNNNNNNNNNNSMDQQGQQQQQPSVFGNNYASNSNNMYSSTRGFVPLSLISSIQPQPQQTSQFVSNNNYINGYANNAFTPSNYAVSQPELYRHNNTNSATTANNNAYYGDEEDEDEDEDEEEIDDDFDFDGLFDATADDDNDAGAAVADVYDYDNINKKTVPVAVLHSASNNSISNNSMSIDMDHHHVMSSSSSSPAAVAVNSSSGKTTLAVPGIDNNNSPQSVTMISSIDTDNTSHLSGHSASASTKTNQLYSAASTNGENSNSKNASASMGNNIATKEGIAANYSTATPIATTNPLNISNISEIMQVLPKHLQERFIDQLALSIGQNVLSMPMSGGGFDENIMAGRCSSEVLSNVTAELDWQVNNASAGKCTKAHQQLEEANYFKQQLQHDYSGDSMTPNNNNTDNNQMVMTNDDPMAVVTASGMIPMRGDSTAATMTATTGSSMGVTTLEEHCPLVALGALLASVRLSTSGATESAVQVFSKSCSNFKEKINKLSNHPAVMNASATTKMLPMSTLSIPRLMKTNSSKKDLLTTTGSNSSSSGKSDGEQLSSLAVGPEEDISIYSI